MNALEIFGVLLMVLPFIGAFGVLAGIYGFWRTLSLFLVAFGIAACFAGGAILVLRF